MRPVYQLCHIRLCGPNFVPRIPLPASFKHTVNLISISIQKFLLPDVKFCLEIYCRRWFSTATRRPSFIYTFGTRSAIMHTIS